jgi:hypothetical protein
MNLWIAKEGANWFRVSFVEDNRKRCGGMMTNAKLRSGERDSPRSAPADVT